MTAIVKLDPRSKLVLIACLSSTAVIINDLAVLSGLLAIAVMLLLLSGINPLGVMVKIRMLLYMVLFIAVMQSIFVPGTALINIGSIKLLSINGLILAGEFVLRMLIIIVSAGILSTSSSREIIQGLVQWRLPYEVAFMAAMGIRFLPVFAEEFQNAMTAVQLRGINLKKLPLRQKAEVFASLFQPVVAGALIQSKAISISIEMRGFRSCPKRTSYLQLEYQGKDYGVMIGSIMFTVMLMFWYFGSGRT